MITGTYQFTRGENGSPNTLVLTSQIPPADLLAELAAFGSGLPVLAGAEDPALELGSASITLPHVPVIGKTRITLQAQAIAVADLSIAKMNAAFEKLEANQSGRDLSGDVTNCEETISIPNGAAATLP